MTLSIVDNDTFVGADGSAGAFNVGAGTINVSGTHTGGFTVGGDITAGLLNVSGLNTAAAAGAAGFTMGGKATAAITITGSNGADTLTGSALTDTINGGAGNDVLANMANAQGGVGVLDTLTGGTGNDQFILRGDTAAAAIPTTYGTSAVVTDMTVGTTIGATDFITVSANTANYNVTNTAAFALRAAATAQGAWTVQVVGSAGTVAITNNANELIKLTSGVVTTGLTLQTAFNTAIGTALVTAATADKSYFFTMYDLTNSKMIVGIVQDHKGNTTKIETGDIVSLVGTVNMSASDYANLGTNNFSVVAA